MGQRFIPDSYMFSIWSLQVDVYTGDPQRWPFTKAERRAVALQLPRGLDVMALLRSSWPTILVDDGTRIASISGRVSASGSRSSMVSRRHLESERMVRLSSLKAWWRTCRGTRISCGRPRRGRSLHAALASWTELRSMRSVRQKAMPPSADGPHLPPPGYIEPAAGSGAECWPEPHDPDGTGGHAVLSPKPHSG
jgi:hypothetical protein